MTTQYKKIVFYLMAVAVLSLNLGFSYEKNDEDVRNVAFASTKITDLTEKSLHEEISIVAQANQSPSENNTDDIKVDNEEKVVEEILDLFYQIDVQYLNVRNNNDAKSKIKDVLVKDWVVKVEKIEDNGWLLLTEGGYINGKYAKTIEKNEAIELISQQESKPKPKPVFEQPKPKAVEASVSVQTSNVQRSGNNISVGVTGTSNATVQQLEQILAGTGLEGIGSALISVEDTFGINAFFTLAVARLESGNGTSRLAQGKNNIFGMNAIDGNAYNAAFTYGSKSESVMDFGHRIKKNYINKGLSTLGAINTKYSSSSSWASKVEHLMHSDANKIK